MSKQKPQTEAACGCCEAATPATPETIQNRPALPAIRYRVGTFGTFRQAMLEGIAHKPELRGWTTRTSDDYGIALLEMWAYVGDILTFYQERIANEAYLRTAIFRESLLCHANTLDYHPAPGVAASTGLAFFVEEGKQVDIPIGLLVQSVPGQDEKPEKFETIEALTALAGLSRARIYPLPQAEESLVTGTSVFTVLSDINHLAPADKLVIWTEAEAPAAGGMLHVEDKTVADIRTVDWRQELEFEPAIRKTFGVDRRVNKWVRKLRLFGHNAPERFLTPVVTGTGPVTFKTSTYDPTSSARVIQGSDETELDLDAAYDDLKENTRLLVVSPDVPSLNASGDQKVDRLGNPIFFARLRATEVEVLRAEQMDAQVKDATNDVPFIQATVTKVVVKGDFSTLNSRHTVIYELAGPEIVAWDQHYGDTISGDEIHMPLQELGVDEAVAEQLFEPGRRIIFDDEHGAALAATVKESQVVPSASGAGVVRHLLVGFTPALQRSLDAATAVLYGNVVQATHGETIAEEVLGSGDASAEFLRFVLKKSPVTHVPRAGAPHGAASTLQVRVNQVLWHEQPTLYGQTSDARVFATSIDRDSLMSVQFGDGATGERLPTGKNNIVATYRQGIGKAGNVAAAAISTLRDRPVGLTGVVNPDASAGGAEAETNALIRQNAPNVVRTFGRIVSLRDFEDAAREFSGVAKAKAFLRQQGVRQQVRLTVAGDDGATVVLDNLRADLDARRDPNRLLVIENYQPIFVRIEAKVFVHPDHLAEVVIAAATAALVAYLTFDSLKLGQPIHSSDIYRAAQDVDGVVAVDVDLLHFKYDEDAASHEASDDPVQARLRIYANELAALETPISDVLVSVGTEQP